MPVGVVDPLEVVQVHHQYGQCASRAPHPVECAVGRLRPPSHVEQAGLGVGHHRVLELVDLREAVEDDRDHSHDRHRRRHDDHQYGGDGTEPGGDGLEEVVGLAAEDGAHGRGGRAQRQDAAHVDDLHRLVHRRRHEHEPELPKRARRGQRVPVLR